MKLASLTLASASLLVASCSAEEAADNTVGNAIASEDVVVDELVTDGAMEVCDEAGNRYASDAEAEAAGLDPAQYGATYCSEYLAKVDGVHPSWDVNEDGLNDCEDEGICDDSVDYSQPRP